MKLIRQVRLHFRDGSSDKVYEVDLCEISEGRFVVNFRYGRRGAVLKDGSKTPLPVGEAEAERIFTRLVESKTTKGYAETATGTPRPVSPPPATTPTVVRVEDLADPRHQRLATLLADRTAGGWTRQLDRIVFRIGELRVQGLTNPLVDKLGGASDKTAWNLLRALLRCGDASALPAVFGIWEGSGTQGWVKSMAAHTIVALAPPAEATTFLEGQRERIPPSIWRALSSRRWEAVLADLEDQPFLLDLMYLCARPGSSDRDAVLQLLQRVTLQPPLWRSVRRVFKAAEAKGDGEVYGLLAQRFQTSRPMYRSFWGQNGYVPGIGRVKRLDPRLGFSGATRKYLIRRTWRTLRRLGDAGMARDYTDLATGVLLAVTDQDGRPPRRITSYDWRQRRQVTSWTPKFGHMWTLSMILFRESPAYRVELRKMSFQLRSGANAATLDPLQRHEAYSELWDQASDRLVDLLLGSQCVEVQDFAARALRRNPDAWSQIPTARLLGLFGSPHPATAELAADIAITRYDPTAPDFELVMALASCPYDSARSTALGWVRANPPVFLSNVDFVVQLILNPQGATRRAASDILGATAMTGDHATIVVEAVLAHARGASPDDAVATDTLRDAAGILLSSFSQELRSVPLDQVTELVTHPVEGVAELGAKILLGHDVRPPDLPDDLLAAVMTSPFVVVRGIGIRMYGELSDAVLTQRFRVLCDLITNPNADVRHAVRPLVVRLSKDNPGFAKVLVAAILPALTVAAPAGVEGMHADIVALFRGDLAPAVATLGTEAILSLLRSPESVVQELGGDLLRAHVDPTALDLAQIAELASSDILAIREASWSMLESRVEEAREAPDALLDVLDASWEDSRAFGFHLVDAQVGAGALSPELAIAICDSVRPDVQAFGRRIVTQMFGSEAGPTYLLKLSQHPAEEMQLFASAWLDAHGSGDPERLQQLVPYLVSVLTRPNRGRIAKMRVMAFLDAEADRSETSARVVASLLGELSLTAAVSYRAQSIGILARILRRFPDIDSPLVAVPVERRDAVEVRDAV